MCVCNLITKYEAEGEWIKLHRGASFILGDQFKEDEMGWLCGMYGRGEILIQGNMKERDHVEDIRRRWEENIKTGWEDVDWIRLVWDRDKWRTLYKHGSKLKCMHI